MAVCITLPPKLCRSRGLVVVLRRMRMTRFQPLIAGAECASAPAKGNRSWACLHGSSVPGVASAKGGNPPTMEAGDAERPVDWPESVEVVRVWPARGLVGPEPWVCVLMGELAGEAPTATDCEVLWKYGFDWRSAWCCAPPACWYGGSSGWVGLPS